MWCSLGNVAKKLWSVRPPPSRRKWEEAHVGLSGPVAQVFPQFSSHGSPSCPARRPCRAAPASLSRAGRTAVPPCTTSMPLPSCDLLFPTRPSRSAAAPPFQVRVSCSRQHLLIFFAPQPALRRPAAALGAARPSGPAVRCALLRERASERERREREREREMERERERERESSRSSGTWSSRR